MGCLQQTFIVGDIGLIQDLNGCKPGVMKYCSGGQNSNKTDRTVKNESKCYNVIVGFSK